MCTEGLLDFITVLWSWPLGNKDDAALKLIAFKHMSKKDCININTRDITVSVTHRLLADITEIKFIVISPY